MYECLKLDQDKNIISCNNHPHNIYFEILVNLGLTGMCIFIILLFFIIKKIFNSLLEKNVNDIQKSTLIFFLTLFITELMPLRSFGSIFQTVNGSIFWFFLALLSSIHLPKSLIKK